METIVFFLMLSVLAILFKSMDMVRDIDLLKREIDKLKNENKCLKEYVDDLFLASIRR